MLAAVIISSETRIIFSLQLNLTFLPIRNMSNLIFVKSFFSVDLGAGTAGAAVSGAIGGAGFAITKATPLGRIAEPVVNSAFGVTAGVVGNLVEQSLDSKSGINKLAVAEAGFLGLISGNIPIKTNSYKGKGFSGKTSLDFSYVHQSFSDGVIVAMTSRYCF